MDPAELEWLIYNADNLDNGCAPDLITHQFVNAEEVVDEEVIYSHGVVENNNVCNGKLENVITPMKSSNDAVRRSSRITNRSGPFETVARYTLAAKKKGLELQAVDRNKKNDLQSEVRSIEFLIDEDWNRVAEGAGYIISPRKKESAGIFLKDTTPMPA